MFVNDTSDKGLISKIYKEFTQCNTRKTDNPTKKWAKDLNRHFSKDDTHVAHRHMKKCSTSLTIREMQVKTSMRYELIPARTTIINKSINKYWQGCGERSTLVHCWLKRQTDTATVWSFLKKLKMEPPFDQAIPLLGIYTKNSKTPIQKNICTPML